ncbi:cupin domain-containing protein [Actinomadura roseirufa]|uniref:cupin domain-containing protein n=1 Tax=Actinomadura roseirufa TaxID=2094049 RepID=UPI0010414CD3|nr:cupin domain-containing protein [Actinomadura roseirufa]
MTQIEVKSFEKPDETRQFKEKGKVELLELGARTAFRAEFEPGWRWTVNVRPVVGTDLCETAHFGFVASGRLRITMADGEQRDIGPGEVYLVEPGHDAEVLGNETCVAYDFGEVADYAKPN